MTWEEGGNHSHLKTTHYYDTSSMCYSVMLEKIRHTWAGKSDHILLITCMRSVDAMKSFQIYQAEDYTKVVIIYNIVIYILYLKNIVYNTI